MTAGWVAFLAAVAAILWLGIRLKPKATDHDSPPAAAPPPDTQEPEDRPVFAALKVDARRVSQQLNDAWAIQDDRQRLAALEHVEETIWRLNASATAQGVEITDAASTLDSIALLKARSNPLTPAEGNTLVAIVDTETTGLEACDEPISIGLLLLEYAPDKGELVKEHQRLYMLREPNVPIHPRAQAVHGLSLDDLRGKTWDLPTLARALSSASIVAAHNAKFDRRMVAHILPYTGHLQWACTIHALNRDWSKLMADSRSLDALCAQFSIARPAPHNALTDAIALQALLAVRTGKTAHSRTLMGALINNPWSPPYAPED